MDTSDDRPVIALITAKTCTHCHTFRSKVWSDLKPRLETDGRLRVVEIDLDSTDSKPSDSYPQDLRRFLRWFPMVILSSGASWNQGLRRAPNAKLDAVVFSGQINGDQVSYQPGPAANKDTIFAWINEEIQKPAFASQVGGTPVVGQQRPKVVFTTDGRPLGAQRPVDVVPTMGSVCSRKYRARGPN